MYGYKEYVPLTIEEILKRVTQEEIFKIVLNQDIIVGREHKYKAPYRNDIHADCYFEEYNGILTFIDFADFPFRPKNCFTFLERYYNLSFKEALSYVNQYFKLGLGYSSDIVKRELENGLKISEVVEEFKKSKTITFLPRKFSYKDKKFWSKYEISKQNLIDDKVIPIELFKSTNRKGEDFISRPIDIMYAYTDFDNKIKIYRPYGNKFEKWFTNCTQDDIGSLNSLPEEGNILVISKSYKDCRVIRNQGVNSVWFQNEGMIPNKTILKQLCDRFKKIYIWFDNDQTGLGSGKFVTDYLNNLLGEQKCTHIYLPPKLLREYNIKDPADMISLLGKEELQKFMKLKEIL